MRTLFHIISFAFVGLFIAAALLLLVSTFKLSFFPLDVRSVLTGSMEPAIQTGSLVFIFPQDEYLVDDVVTFRPDGRDQAITITHRIISIEKSENEETTIKTKGDANQVADSDPVRESDIIGKVIFHLPYLGHLLDLAKTPWGFAALIIIPALLVIVDEVKKIIAQVRRKKDDGNEEQKTE